MTLLKKFLDEYSEFLKKQDFSVSYDESQLPKSCSANLDSARYVGTITHWPETAVEIQFNECLTGEVAVLENIEVNGFKSLAGVVMEIIEKRLK